MSEEETEMISVRLPKSLLKLLDAVAEKETRNRTQAIIVALTEYTEKKGEKNGNKNKNM